VRTLTTTYNIIIVDRLVRKHIHSIRFATNSMKIDKMINNHIMEENGTVVLKTRQANGQGEQQLLTGKNAFIELPSITTIINNNNVFFFFYVGDDKSTLNVYILRVNRLNNFHRLVVGVFAAEEHSCQCVEHCFCLSRIRFSSHHHTRKLCA